jgi:hypothetical protein
MLTIASRSVSVILGLFRIPLLPNDLVRCPACDGDLDLHQPDPGDPDRLLGVCEECGDWFLMDLMPDQAEWMVVPLPEVGFFRNSSGG